MNFPAILSHSTKRQKLSLNIYGDAILRRDAEPVRDITADDRDLAAAMTDLMHEQNGIGLAAPQIGHSVRIIVLDIPEPSQGLRPTASPGERYLCPRMPVTLINPDVSPVGTTTDCDSEGCLSIPDVSADVVRPTSIYLNARLINGKCVKLECGGLLARCLQHEIDHLDGVLFVDRLAAEQKRKVAPNLREIEKQRRRKPRRRV